jgi:uncharacterized membrane protein YfcA
MIDATYATAGALTGFAVGLTGVGGGALMTPILLLFFGVSPATAVATDLWFAVITKLVATTIHDRAGTVDWQIVKRLWLGSLPMAVLVVALIALGAKLHKVSWLSLAIGVVVLLTAAGLLLAPFLSNVARNRRLSAPVAFKAMQPGLTVCAGAVLGLLVALTSIGAGALGSVVLLYLYPLRMTPHRLIATDIVHAIPLAAVAGTGYLLAGLVDGAVLINLLAGSIPAVIAGSFLAKKLNGRWLQVALALVLFCGAAKMFSGA